MELTVMSQILFPFLVVMNALVVAIALIQARSISQVFVVQVIFAVVGLRVRRLMKAIKYT